MLIYFIQNNMPSLNQILNKIKSAKLADFDAWRGRLVVWIAAAIAGLVVVCFAEATEHVISWFFSIQLAYWWAPILLTPLGGLSIVYLTRRWFAGAAGSGIPQTIAALKDGTSEETISRFLSLKLATAKIILGLGALASGFSAGREGPSVQVAASVMYAFRRFLPKNFAIHPKHLILAGGAAGISAAFNTPLAGIVFAIEELGRRFEQKTNGVVISAIVLSGLVSVSLQGNYTYFGNIVVSNVDRHIFIPLLICGVVCGVAGGLFSRTLIESSSKLDGRVGHFRSMHPVRWAGFCGLMVALLGLISDGHAHGSGYIYTQNILDGSVMESWQYAPIKYLATIFTYFSGVPGGIFAPSLSIGAGIGSDLLPFFAQQHIAEISTLCMAGFLAAVTQAPLTSFIIVMEMVDGHQMVISLMLVALMAAIISRIFSLPLYETLAAKQSENDQS